MELIYIAFIVISAFGHSFYNFLMHKFGGSRLFLMLLFSIASLFATVNYLFHDESILLDWQSFLTIYSASVFYVLYQISVTKAYERGEISKLYPLTVLSPIFVPILATIFLKEHLNAGIMIGILITASGAIIVKQTSLNPRELKHLFSVQGSYKGAGFAIFASILYSVGSVIDKSKIGEFHLDPYLWILLSCMSINMFLFALFFERETFKEFKSIKWKAVTIAGFFGFVSFYTFRFALKHVDVILAVPIRQSSIFFAILLGVLFAKEKLTVNKVVGVLVIISGIILINFSA